LGPQPDGRLAVYEVRVPLTETGVAVRLPAVDRHAVLPHREMEPVLADLVRGHLVRQHDAGLGILGQNQAVQPVEQGPVLGPDGLDVLPHCVVHTPIVISPVTVVGWRRGGEPPRLQAADRRCGPARWAGTTCWVSCAASSIRPWPGGETCCCWPAR